MFKYLAALLAVVVLLVAAGEADAGVRVVRRGFLGRTVIVDRGFHSRGVVVDRGFHNQPRVFVDQFGRTIIIR